MLPSGLTQGLNEKFALRALKEEQQAQEAFLWAKEEDGLTSCSSWVGDGGIQNGDRMGREKTYASAWWFDCFCKETSILFGLII